MFLSIITPFKGNISPLLSTLDSYKKCILSTNLKYEILIISADHERIKEKIKSYKKININLIKEDSFSGIYNAMNIGIKHSMGDYLIFINCGDLITKSFIDMLIKLRNFNLSNDYLLSMTVGQRINDKYILRRIPPRSKFSGLVFNPWSHCGILFPGKKLRSSPYTTKYKCAADWEKVLDLLFNQQCIYKSIFLKSPAVIADISGYSAKNKKICLDDAKLIKKKYYLKNSKINKILANLSWVIFVIEQFIKKNMGTI